jgi:Icc-related predicted phosphoesterase
MKLLCVSDTVDPVVYNDRIREVFPGIDAVFCAGDLPMHYIDFIVSNLNRPTFFVFGNHDNKEARRDTPAQEMADMGFAPHAITAAGFKGDAARSRAHPGETFHGAFRSGFINQRVKVASGTLLVAGAPGCMRYNNGDFQFTENQMRRHLQSLVPGLLYNKLWYGRYLDVFLTHAPPRGLHDAADPCHRGFQCFRDFMDRFEPRLLVHGHIHLYGNDGERQTVYGKTTVLNAFDHYVYDLDHPPEVPQ